MAWDGENLARVDNNFFAVDPELQRTLENISDLLVLVAMQRNNAALLHQHSSHHDVLPDDQLPLQQRIQAFQLDCAPREMFQFALSSGRLFPWSQELAGPASCAFAD
jgi:hypothetical protein